MEPGLYRSKSHPGFGVWFLTHHGVWLFSMPLEGQVWKKSNLELHDLEALERIA